MALLTYSKGAYGILSLHFKSNEFDCPCSQCSETKIDSDLIVGLEALRSQAGPLEISSGYRCQHYQDDLRSRGYETAVGISQHQLGRAADVVATNPQYTGVTLEPLARTAGFMAVGVAKTWIHVDLRSDKIRRWEYVK